MSWPAGFAEGCRMLKFSDMNHLIDAANERIDLLNENNGKTVIAPFTEKFRLPVDRNLVEALGPSAYDITNATIMIARNFTSSTDKTGWVPLTRGLGIESKLKDLFGNPWNILQQRMSPRLNADWMFCIYNWLNSCIYPCFQISFQLHTDYMKAAKVADRVENRERKEYVIYTKPGSSVEDADHDVHNGFAWSNIPYAYGSILGGGAQIDRGYDEYAEVVSGWDIAGGSYINGTYIGIDGYYNSVISRTRRKSSKGRFYSTNNYIEGDLNCRVYIANTSKWTETRADGIKSTYYPENLTYLYGTINGETGPDVAIPVHEDPDYEREYSAYDGWIDPEKTLYAAQYFRTGEVAVWEPQLPQPNFTYWNK